MPAVTTLRPEFADSFPAAMQEGVLYVSIPYCTCGHLCCCGCGHEVVTPLSPARWSLTYDGQNVSLHPSVGNWALACQSHYWIRKGKVVWSRRYSPSEVAENREYDRRRLAEEIGEASTDKPVTGPRRPRRKRRSGS